MVFSMDTCETPKGRDWRNAIEKGIEFEPYYTKTEGMIHEAQSAKNH